MSAGDCQAVVVACIDYRFVDAVQRLLDDQGLRGSADLVGFPGGGVAPTLDDFASPVNGAVELAVGLHDPERIVLVAHQDCGALGGSKAFNGPGSEVAALETRLREAAGIVGQATGLPVDAFRLTFEGAVAVDVGDPA